MNAYSKIRKAMLANERKVLAFVRRTGVYDPLLPSSRAWRNALDRLEAKGRIKYSRRRGGYVVSGVRS